jgi:hypothetical protein
MKCASEWFIPKTKNVGTNRSSSNKNGLAQEYHNYEKYIIQYNT